MIANPNRLTATICSASYLVYRGIQDLRYDDPLSVFHSLDFAAVDPLALKIYPWLHGITTYVLLTNIPQVVISLVYFSYNSVFTSMLLNYE